MNTMRISLLMCALVAFSNVASAQDRNPQGGQGQRPKPETTAWWDQPVVRDLGLSEEQNKKIRATVAESRDRLIQLRSAADKAEAALQQIMDEEKVDLRRGREAIDQVVAARAEMMRAVAQMSLKLRAILTSAQWQILQERESQPPPPLPGQPQRKR
jgi:Spy/CpxP family protein refolding chaperone